jgi:hypothetical protein
MRPFGGYRRGVVVPTKKPMLRLRIARRLGLHGPLVALYRWAGAADAGHAEQPMREPEVG